MWASFARTTPPTHKYSASTALNRLWLWHAYKLHTDPQYRCKDIAELLDTIGYGEEDISLLRKKAREEAPIFHGHIEHPGFFME